MSEEGADGDEPKKAYSSKLMQMRFMQRPKAKAAAVVTEEEVVVVKKEGDGAEEWSGSRGSEAGCTVIMEGDPPPGAVTGRMSFQGSNVKTEDGESAAEIKKEEEQSPGGKAVSDEEMGRQLAPPPKRRKSGGEQEKLATPRNDTGGRYFAQ